ncbi:hypothetical protein GCM10022243_33240 [Saccharothrix violaceirubra]|uniref:AMIN-like domain-containing protein n=1 Tax=Saccharothrix violaceirubra TaxID=413306 RepID=A0A7W7WUE9_9PSEU|nr:hypothetical protein [Saccharothrix violaceirubra]MBB4964174.1 hypothetical protein [Saccharothrix violaceirubra]
MKRRIALLLAAVLGITLVAPVAASATPGYCGIAWGSGVKSTWPTVSGALTNIRSGRQECYDRLVFDFRGENDGYHVRYVDQVTHDGSGEPVPLRGGAFLQVAVHSPAYDPETGTPTYPVGDPAELVDVTGYSTFRQVAWAGSFEGTTTVGLGVRARLPFRVFTLPGRVVVDVAHFW